MTIHPDALARQKMLNKSDTAKKEKKTEPSDRTRSGPQKSAPR